MAITERPDPGIVYILTNQGMPGMIKIGLTRQDDVAVRMRQLYTTAHAYPFECSYSARVPDCARLEKVLHRVFGDSRISSQREFFRADPELARLIIDLVKIEDLPISDADQGITPDQRAEIETAKEQRAPRLNFERLGLAAGTVLTFQKDPTITCEVAGPNRVRFNGQVLSASAAALQAIHALGYRWTAISGSDHWLYDGKTLSSLGSPATEPREQLSTSTEIETGR